MNRRKLRRKRIAAKPPEVSLTPLIDMALTLLVIFMITTPMLTNMINVELPSSHSNDKAEHLDKYVIYIDKDEKIYLNNKSISEGALKDALQDAVKGETNQTAIIKGDKEIHYGKLIDIYDMVKLVDGFKYVALATEKA